MSNDLTTLENLLGKVHQRNAMDLRSNNIEELRETLECYKKVEQSTKVTIADRVSATLAIAYVKDRLEFLLRGQKTNEFSDMFLAECAERWAKTMRNGSFVITKRVADVVLQQLAYLAEKDWFSFALRPMDRQTVAISYMIDYENMPNWFIYKMNNEKDLSIPTHDSDEVEGQDDIDIDYMDSMYRREDRIYIRRK